MRPAREFLYLLPDSDLILSCPGEGAVIQLEGRLALVPLVGRGRPVYRVSEATLFVYYRGVLLEWETGTGVFWPRLPGGDQRLVLDLGGTHFDSALYPFFHYRDLRIELFTGGICAPYLSLHLSYANPEDSSVAP